MMTGCFKARWWNLRVRWNLVVLMRYSLICDESITVAFETHRRQLVKSSFTGRKWEFWGKERGCASSPGWRVWTACFGPCVSGPATSCSQHALTWPRKRCSVSTGGELRPPPESSARCLATAEPLSNPFYIDGLFLVMTSKIFCLRESEEPNCFNKMAKTK